MNTALLESEADPASCVSGTTVVPVCVVDPLQFGEEALTRLPLAESVLRLWQQVADPILLQELFEKHRGRAYQKTLSFPCLVQLIADALLQYDGSARASFERAREQDALPVTIPAAYGKLRRLPIAVSTAFLSEGTARLQTLLPQQTAAALPHSLKGFHVTVLDGKTIKRVAKRLKVLRSVPGGLLGGKTLVALELNTGLAVAMAAHPDGECNELRLMPELVPEVRQRVPGPRLWVGDRQYCDLEQTGRFTEHGDHFVVRYHPKVHFYPDAQRGTRKGCNGLGQHYREEWGWLGAPSDRRRRYVRRIILSRPGSDDLILVTDLENSRRYPALDILAVYHARWGIEEVFQQITEVFPLKRLIGGSPRAGIFQMAFCLLLYNMIHVLQAYIAAAENWEPADVSLEKLFEDVERELIAWTVMVKPTITVTVLGAAPTPAQLKKHLTKLLKNVWQDHWLKVVNEKPRPHRPAARKTARTHTSVHRVLEDHRRQLEANRKLNL
jgi:hypothetical protein